jgi:hypothetical protein
MINRASPRQADTVATDGGFDDLAPHGLPAFTPTSTVVHPPELAPI